MSFSLISHSSNSDSSPEPIDKQRDDRDTTLWEIPLEVSFSAIRSTAPFASIMSGPTSWALTSSASVLVSMAPRLLSTVVMYVTMV